MIIKELFEGPLGDYCYYQMLVQIKINDSELHFIVRVVYYIRTMHDNICALSIAYT